MYMRYSDGHIKLSNDAHKNYLRHDGLDYMVTSISTDFKKSKGGNSSVFRLTPQEGDALAIKFSKYDVSTKEAVAKNSQRIERFNREIEALRLVKSSGLPNLVEYFFDAELRLGSRLFPYYVMEQADSDLTTYLEANEVTQQQRFLLCVDILKGIQGLHGIGIYHRDIKPDNILFVRGEWKIGDLGLVDFQDSDFDIDEVGERIGPRDWLSPEAFNKCLTENRTKALPYQYDCRIAAESDVYQLGKLFWFIFQGNLPEGQLVRKDFRLADKALYDIIYNMLWHSKENRYSLKDIEDGFKSRYSHYGI